mgnify:CR=1 FL=1
MKIVKSNVITIILLTIISISNCSLKKKHKTEKAVKAQREKDTFAAKPVNFEVLKVGSGGRINDVSGFAAKPVNFEVLKVGSGGRINDVSGFAAKPVNFEVKQDGAHCASFEVGNPYESVHE